MGGAVIELPELRAQKRLWVTQLTALLCGAAKCEWPVWVLSRYEIPPEPETEVTREYNRRHGELLKTRAEELKTENRPHTLETDNWISVLGRSGTKLTGKPDIIIDERQSVTYEDCKSGKRKPEHHVQVLLYAQMGREIVRRAQREGHAIELPDYAGNLIYLDGIEHVDMGRAGEVASAFAGLMERVNSDSVKPSPSVSDCRYCKIRAYCPDRIGSEPTYSGALGDVRR
jgi:hypothetical protein